MTSNSQEKAIAAALTSAKPAANAEQKKAALAAKKARKPRHKKIEHAYPVEPRTIQVIKKPKTFMDHSYRDFSKVPAEMKYVHPTEISEMSFGAKVHAILSTEEYAGWIHWLPHGRAFKIAIPKRLEQGQVLLKYFGHNRFSSFLRQLNNYGFKHITTGVDRNSYYHECMLRGLPHLTKYMPPSRDARRLIPDPDNEPDFYAISRLYPVPASGEAKPAAESAPVASAAASAVDPPAAPPVRENVQNTVRQSEASLLAGLTNPAPSKIMVSPLELLQQQQQLQQPAQERYAALLALQQQQQPPRQLPLSMASFTGPSQIVSSLQPAGMVAPRQDQQQQLLAALLQQAASNAGSTNASSFSFFQG